ncbi:MAG: NADPH-dependent FMN reductase [Planctomycetota bacterium]
MHIVVICGTNREGALSRLLSQQLAGLYRDRGAEVDLIDMAELPPEVLLGTAYKEPAPAITALVERFCAADGVHFVVPEYNGGFPGILKLFIDMLPYPAGLDARPCAFVGLAAGQFKGLRPVEHLQQVIGYRNGHCFPRRLFIGDSFKTFDYETKRLSEASLNERITQQVEQFLAYITALDAQPAKSIASA